MALQQPCRSRCASWLLLLPVMLLLQLLLVVLYEA
jgi:hypothetical protein